MRTFNALDPAGKVKQSIVKAIDHLKQDPTAGNKIVKRLWPEQYKRKYQINNLFRYPLADGWRLTYTMVGDENVITSIILDALDHTAYDKLFGYHSS